MNITLYDYQTPHLENIKEKFLTEKIIFDLSIMGSGKSMVMGKLSEEYDFVLVITYPNIINHSWTLLREKYKLNIEFLSINILRGMKSSPLNHSYLTREDTYKNTIFKSSQEWANLCAKKTLLIIDEVQMIKNRNIGFYAVHELIREIRESKNSRCILMSGTPIDNTAQIQNYIKLTGITEEFDNLCVKMEPPPHKHKINGYYIYKSIDAKYAPDKDTDIKTYLNKLELYKANLFCEEVKKIYYECPNAKIILSLFFIDAINRCAEILKVYKPAIILGETKHMDRTAILARFNKPNNDLRILIANTSIISTGINLDDEDGNYPRYFVMSPNHMIMVIHQLQYRILRANTKSDGEIRIVLCKEIDEREIIESMYLKSETMSIYTHGTIFPANFETINC